MPPPLTSTNMLSSTMTSSFPNASSIGIVLTEARSKQKRTLHLVRGGSSLTIGRASRSKIKDLKEAPDNALFDCPVVSRSHAELRATLSGAPDRQVTITDKHSMHGTFVNNKRIGPGVPFTLVPGDVIKLGERVTQGEHVYEGTSLTFSRLPSVSDSYRRPSYPTSSAPVQRGYRVPSISEASDIESDIISVASDQEEEDTSAHTTPGHLKMKLGTQDSPINLDLGDNDSSSIIDLDGVDDEGPRAKPTSAQFQAAREYGEPLSEAENDDELDSDADEGAMSEHLEEAQSEFDEVDEDDELEFDYDNGFGDDFSESGSDQQSVGEDQDREASLELGTSFDEYEPAEQVEEVIPNRAAMEPISANLTTKARYDPVRSSQPPLESNSQAVKATTYTYGFQGYNDLAIPATDFQCSSRFDIGPTGLYEPQLQNVQSIRNQIVDPINSMPSNMPPWTRDQMARQTAITEDFASFPELSYLDDFSYPTGPQQSIPAPEPTIKNRMSIGGIVDTVDTVTPIVPQATRSAVAPAEPTASSSTNKRKADEMMAGEDEQRTEPPAKKIIQAPVVTRHVRSVLPARRPRLPKRRVLQDAALMAGKIVAGTAVGTFLLGSPMVSCFLEWAKELAD